MRIPYIVLFLSIIILSLGDLIEYTDIFVYRFHPSCTCAMLPQSQGGVVDANLKVYGLCESPSHYNPQTCFNAFSDLQRTSALSMLLSIL